MVSKLGPKWGANVGIIVPTLGIAALGWYCPTLIVFLTGVRLSLFVAQRKSEMDGN